MSTESVWRHEGCSLNGLQDYWTRDVAGFYARTDAGGGTYRYIDMAFAKADLVGAARYGIVGKPAPKSGYWFCVMQIDETGAPYQRRLGVSQVPCSNPFKYAFCAYPAGDNEEDRVLIVNEEGIVYVHEGRRKPVLRWPGPDPTVSGWIAAD